MPVFRITVKAPELREYMEAEHWITVRDEARREYGDRLLDVEMVTCESELQLASIAIDFGGVVLPGRE